MKADYWSDIYKCFERQSVSFMKGHLEISKIPSIVEMAHKSLEEKELEDNDKKNFGLADQGYIRGYCVGRVSMMFL